MATIVAVCPYCNTGKVRAPSSAVGASANCPKCGSSFTLMPSSGAPGWGTPGTRPGAAPPVAETSPAASLPDVTEPSPIATAEEIPDEPKPKRRKAAPSPVVSAPEPDEPAEATDVGFLFALGALILVGPAVLATLFPYGRFIAAGLSGFGILVGLLAQGGEARARLLGVAAVALHLVLLLVVLVFPSWLNLDPWRPVVENGPEWPQAVSHADQTMSPALWVNPAVASWQYKDIRVNIGSAVVGPVELHGPKEARRTPKDQYLQFQVRVSNVGVERKLELSGWAAGDGPTGIRVTEQGGKVLPLATFEKGWQLPARAKPLPHLFPSKSADVKFVFAAPPAKADYVRVELPGAAVGLPEETIKFQLTGWVLARTPDR